MMEIVIKPAWPVVVGGWWVGGGMPRPTRTSLRFKMKIDLKLTTTLSTLSLCMTKSVDIRKPRHYKYRLLVPRSQKTAD